MIALSTVLSTCLFADSLTSPGSKESVSAPGTQPDIEQLERDITNTRIKNQVVKGKNRELNSRVKELENRIKELKNDLITESAKQEEIGK